VQELVAALVAFFIIDPLKAELGEKLAAARVPPGIVREVTACATAATPVVVERLSSDPLWAAGAVIRVWAGLAPPETVLAEAAPACRPAIDRARPYLTGSAA
jgi:hypothetical protein